MNQLMRAAGRGLNTDMKVGVCLLGVANIGTGILDLIWRDFDASHQPIDALGVAIPGRKGEE